MRKRSLLILPLLCICSLIVFTNALSKSDRKVRKPLEPEPEQEHEDENTARRNVEKAERDFEQMQQKMRRNPQDNSLRGWRPAKIKFDPLTMVTRDRILRDEKSFYIGERVSKLPTLAYITPWNGRGYDLAKWAAKKYTHIAPVWLQILPVDDGETLGCELTGTHDVDHTWIDDVRANNSAIRIVPRVVFENWRPNQLVGLLEQEEWQQACSSMLADYLHRNALDGAVVELWMTVIAMSRRSKIPLLIEMLNSWADKFHKQDLLLITPVPPLSARDGPTGFFTPSDFRALSSVDFVQVMTYDFPGGGAIAPFDWMHKNLFQILNGAPHSAHRLLLGIHHYGYHYAGDNDPVKAVSWDQYLEQLRRPDAELEWDDESAEHYIANGIERIYYPSLSSLEMRLELARKYDVGVAIWELGQGLNYFGQLL